MLCRLVLHVNLISVGSVLLVKSGAGSNIGCFMQLNEETTLSGFIIYYPSQKQDQTPIQYPTLAIITVIVINCSYSIPGTDKGLSA